MPSYSVILLDADNTLFDFDRAEAEALTLTLGAHGLPCTDEVRGCYEAVNRGLWAAFDRGDIAQADLVVERFARTLDKLGLPGDPVALNRHYLARLAEQSFLLPGAVALCEALAPHCTLALATNGVASVQHGRLSRSPLGKFFPHPFISEEIGAQKPQSAFFDAVLTALDVTDRSTAVMVGDSLGSDILGGIQAGLHTIWYNPKGQPPRPDILPTYEADSLSRVASLILS